MANIGFIGLGHMGNPMVKNLLESRHNVLVYDISASAMDDVAVFGAKKSTSIKELVSQVEIVITMLQTGEQVMQVALGEAGVLAHLSPAGLYIDCSSIDVITSREIHRMAREKNIAMVDAPVSGGVKGAQGRSLTFMVGGEDEAFLQAKPILEILGQRVIHAGQPGNGQVAKICNNMILGISMIAVAEAFILAEKLGLDPEKFFEIANNASGQCWSLSKYCPVPGILDNVPANDDYRPGFAAAMMLKDLRLSQAAAEESGAKTPLGAEATALYESFVAQGNGQLDFSGIIKIFS